MNFRVLPFRVLSVCALALGIGCAPPEPTERSIQESRPTSETEMDSGADSTGSATDGFEESSDTGSDGSSSTGSVVDVECGDVSNVDECEGAFDLSGEPVCIWSEVRSLVAGGTKLTDTSTEGRCFERASRSCSLALPTCPDGRSFLKRRTVTTVDLLEATGACYGRTDFGYCHYVHPEGEAGTEYVPDEVRLELAACELACR